MDIERRRYVLSEHRALPEDHQPVWHWALPRAMDVMAARTAATTGVGKDERVDYLQLRNQIFARCIRRLDGGLITKGGVRLAVPESPDITDRLAWVERLPMRWVTEIATVLEAGGDLDDEEEE